MSDGLMVANLGIDVADRQGWRPLLRSVEFGLGRGQLVALVGRSGQGKSALLGCIAAAPPRGVRATGGVVSLGADRIAVATPTEVVGWRGARVALMAQDPASTLNPVARVGAQIAEMARHHRGVGRRAARDYAQRVLAEAGVWRDDVPHRLSGGERRRAALALALAGGAVVLLADEPTVGLDRVASADLLDRLRGHCAGGGICLVAGHDPRVVAAADRVLVLDGGRVRGDRGGPAHAPGVRHRADPAGHPPGAVPMQRARLGGVAVQADDLVAMAGRGRRRQPILAGVTLSLRFGEVVAVVGRSGAGKTTLARVLCGLQPRDGGYLTIDGAQMAAGGQRPRPGWDGRAQMMVQDPYLSFNPRVSVWDTCRHSVADIGRRGGPAIDRDGLAEALGRVGIDTEHARRRPAELSGGQLQRVALVRALIGRPSLLVLDEPLAGVDPTAAEAVIGLLEGVRHPGGPAVMVVTHDADRLGEWADRVVVLSGGRVVDDGPRQELIRAPGHPETTALLGCTDGRSPSSLS